MERSSGIHTVIAATLLSAAIVFGCMLLGQSALDFKSMDRYVSVKGLAEVEVPADLVIWPVSFSEDASTLPELHKALEHSSNVIMQFLQENGLGDAELTPSAPQVTDNWSMNPNNRNVLKYTGRAVVTVRTSEIAKVKKAMTKMGDLVSRGVLLYNDYGAQPMFSFTKLNEIKPNMIAQATQNARQAAKQFAQDSGSKVGSIRMARQGFFSIDDRDMHTPEIKRIRVVTSIDYYLAD